MKNELIKPAGLVKSANRREFLKRGTLSVATVGLLLVGCNDDDDDMMPPMMGGVSLGVWRYRNFKLCLCARATGSGVSMERS